MYCVRMQYDGMILQPIFRRFDTASEAEAFIFTLAGIYARQHSKVLLSAIELADYEAVLQLMKDFGVDIEYYYLGG